MVDVVARLQCAQPGLEGGALGVGGGWRGGGGGGGGEGGGGGGGAGRGGWLAGRWAQWWGQRGRASQGDLHAVMGNLDAVRGQFTPLGRVVHQDRVGVVDVNQYLACCRHLVERGNHAVRAGLRQVAHIAGALG